jgi:hypothetical protein
MAEAIGLAASIIAIVQIADSVIELCKFYIETLHDCPSDIRTILVETSTTKSILESVQFLASCKNGPSTMLEGLGGTDGPIKGCRSAITKIKKLLPAGPERGVGGSKSKREKIEACLATLAWPLKEKKARKLLEEINQHKATINLALTTEST